MRQRYQTMSSSLSSNNYTLDYILDEWEKDSKIDIFQAGKEQIRIPILHSKYLGILSKLKLQSKKLAQDYKDEKKNRWNYYNGYYNTDKEKLEEMNLAPFKFILKSDTALYLDSDPVLSRINSKKDYCDTMISTCESIMLELKQRVWEIKSYLDQERFLAG